MTQDEVRTYNEKMLNSWRKILATEDATVIMGLGMVGDGERNNRVVLLVPEGMTERSVCHLLLDMAEGLTQKIDAREAGERERN
ncbi:MAG: hypothetical protein Q8P00_03355 [Dehalococcoidia bacterium]|nr:hypothetical protein [Dehalococcoidia bacterium]